MKYRNRKYFVSAGIVALLALAGAGIVLSRSGPTPPVREPGPGAEEVRDIRPGEGAGGRHDGDGDDHDRGAGEGKPEEKSDLDRSVEEMWQARCEHGILQHGCDTCRFELGVVKLPAELFARAGKPGLVGVTAAGSHPFRESRSFPGEVGLAEGKTVRVVSPLPGQIRAVFADIGARVAAGAPLLEIDSDEVAAAKGDYLKKEAARDLARKAAEREQKLFEKKISAEAEVQEAQAKLTEAEVERANARTKLLRLGIPETEVPSTEHRSLDRMTGLLTVRAPREGSVLERHASPGERIEAGKELFLLSDLSEVWVWADLREGDVPAVVRRTDGSGRPIPAIVRAPGGKEYRGTLDVLSGTMNEQTRTLKARIVVPNPEGVLRPGMFVTVRLLLSDGGSFLAVPKTALLSDEGRAFVFVHREGEYWIRRPVTPGRSAGEMVEIRSGLAPGQKVIADGSFLLKSDVLRRKMGAGCAD